ncbi:uncharacterized protein LOC143342859 [Colletes latitarsis]|uniref:uncharacterized protein LOC143342859 n=1 Tax=Colletes latitarsis TaxID=2605962 RepID=UPI004036B54D
MSHVIGEHCIFKTVIEAHSVHSIFFTIIYSLTSSDLFNVKDDGRVSTISIASYTTRDEIENFYSCYIHRYRNKSFKDVGQALFTFGITVIDRSKESENILWKEWCFICQVAIACFIIMIIWCLLEILQDVRNGHGFYRLPQIFNNDSTSIINFVQSKNGIVLLGSQQAANEIASGVTEDN